MTLPGFEYPHQLQPGCWQERACYNGWANYETWNVSLWIQNDYETYRKCLGETSYDSCIPRLELMWGQMTPDGVRWMDGLINTQELDEMLTEMKG